MMMALPLQSLMDAAMDRAKARRCERCDSPMQDCYCCETCGSPWCGWLGEHPATRVVNGG